MPEIRREIPVLEAREKLDGVYREIRKIVKPSRIREDNRYTTYSHIAVFMTKDSPQSDSAYLYEENVNDVIELLVKDERVSDFTIHTLGREVCRVNK